MVVAQLVERLLPIPGVCCSNPVIGKNLYWTIFTEKTKIKKKRQGMAHFFKKKNWTTSFFAARLNEKYACLTNYRLVNASRSCLFAKQKHFLWYWKLRPPPFTILYKQQIEVNWFHQLNVECYHQHACISTHQVLLLIDICCLTNAASKVITMQEEAFFSISFLRFR